MSTQKIKVPETWSEYNHLEVAALEDPAPVMARLRRQNPIGHSEQFGGFYVLTNYADCTQAARDPHFSSSTERGPGPGFPYSGVIKPISMINDDGQRHRDFRIPIQEFFSIDASNAMAPKVREICSDLVDKFIERGEADLATQFTMELPAILISELLDLPQHRRHEFQSWASKVVATGDIDLIHKLAGEIDQLYDLRIQSPGEDIPSKLLRFQVDGKPISRVDWQGLVMLLVMGGLDTTANGGALALHMIGTQPDLRKYLLEDLTRIPDAAKELIRLISPVPNHSRGVTGDVVINGHQFKKGDIVELSWIAANRDPAVFQEPDKFIPNRKPNNHVGFGFGPHRCLGANLAMVEMNIMIDEILSRLPDYEVIEAVRFPSINRAMSNLRVKFTPGRRLKP